MSIYIAHHRKCADPRVDSGSLFFVFLTTAEQRMFGHMLAFLIQSTANLYHTWRND